MSSLPPYHYVRWTWWKTYKIEELNSKLGREFTITLLKSPALAEGGMGVSLNTRDIPFIEVKADTLSAFLAPSKAVLFQKEGAPFTKRDVALREAVLSLYAHSIPGPFPFFFQWEPRFEVKETS